MSPVSQACGLVTHDVAMPLDDDVRRLLDQLTDAPALTRFADFVARALSDAFS